MTDRGWKAKLRHAFAVEDPEAFEPTDREREIVQRICREIVRRRMTTPALMLLEMSRPLNYLGAQALHFFQPFASVLVDPRAWEEFAALVEKRGSVEFVCRTIEDEIAAKDDPDDSSSASEASGEASAPDAGEEAGREGRSEHPD